MTMHKHQRRQTVKWFYRTAIKRNRGENDKSAHRNGTTLFKGDSFSPRKAWCRCFVSRCDSEVFPDVTRRCGWWFLRLSQMLQGQRIRFSVIELVQSELEDVVGGDSIEKGQAGTHFHGVNATQYFSGLFRFVVK